MNGPNYWINWKMTREILFFFYLQPFWISSINATNAALHWVTCESELNNLSIALNSAGLAFFRNPCSNDFISSNEWKCPSMLSSCSCFIKLKPKSLVLTSPRELLEPFEHLEASFPLPEDSEESSLWCQYSTHWWLGSWASMAWNCLPELIKTSEVRS